MGSEMCIRDSFSGCPGAAHPNSAGNALHKATAGYDCGEISDNTQPWGVKAFGAHVDADKPVGTTLLKAAESLGCLWILRMHEVHPITLFPQ